MADGRRLPQPMPFQILPAPAIRFATAAYGIVTTRNTAATFAPAAAAATMQPSAPILSPRRAGRCQLPLQPMQLKPRAILRMPRLPPVRRQFQQTLHNNSTHARDASWHEQPDFVPYVFFLPPRCLRRRRFHATTYAALRCR